MLDAKLKTWQNDLIDMSRLNRLLYFSPSGRTSTVHLLEDPHVLFDRMRTGRRPYVIDPERTSESDECEKRLARMRSRAREALNDRGTHVLYLVFGLLEWRESDSSEDVIRSPLLLVPVNLTREGVLGSFQLSRAVDEEIDVNPTLREKLRHDFGIAFPSYSEIAEQAGEEGWREAALSLKVLFAALSHVVAAGHPFTATWSVVPEVHLGTFSYQKLVMYQDLVRHQAEVFEHPLLLALAGDRRLAQPREGLLQAEELDTRLRPHDMLEILDADSSQQEAIVAAKAGLSFVLQGPPGTGKSQTISNIIAECLTQGKTVLFVSEKMAALEVVSQRLIDAGLGEFCLDLHSHRADKKQFVQELQETLAKAESVRGSASSDVRWQSQSEYLEETRAALNRYVRALHAAQQPLHLSPFQAYGMLASLADVPDMDAPLPSVRRWTQVELQRVLGALAYLLNWTDVLDQYESYPWRQTLATEFTLQLSANIRHHFELLIAELQGLGKVAEGLMGLLEGSNARLTFTWLSQTLKRGEMLSRSPLPPVDWLTAQRQAEVRELTTVAAEHARRCKYLRPIFDARYDAAALEVDFASVRRAVIQDSAWAMSCIQAEREPAQDLCLNEREKLAGALAQADSLLDQMTIAAGVLAATCERIAPGTLVGVADILGAAEAIVVTPNPPPSWVEADAFSEVRVAALEALDRWKASTNTRSTLQRRYERQFFDLDVVGMARRFRERYRSLLRNLMPGYHADMKLLRRCLKEGEVLAHAQAQSDLLAAERLLADEQWLRDQRVSHARLFGHFYLGEDTDWERIGAAVRWGDALHRYYPDGMPKAIVGMVTGPTPVRGVLRSQFDQLRAIWEGWGREAAYLAVRVNAAMLLAGTSMVEDTPLVELCGALARLSATLEAFWAGVDTLTQHSIISKQSSFAPAAHPTWAELCADLEMADEVSEHIRWFADRSAMLREVLAHFDRGVDTEWDSVFHALDWSKTFLAEYPEGAVPASALTLASSGGDPASRAEVAQLVDAGRRHLQQVTEELAYSDRVLPRQVLLDGQSALADAEIGHIQAQVAFHLEQLPCLERWIECNRQLRLCEGLGLGAVINTGLKEATQSGGGFPQDLPDRLVKRFYTLWLDDTLQGTPDLRNFQGETQAQTVARFRILDIEHISQARQRVRAQLGERRHRALIDARSDTMGPLAWAMTALQHEVAKKRHPAIRQIVRKTAPALTRIKPCWMMSPLSVSQYVESADQLFDVVIFDEASQVCPEDAISSILRGKQLIVVGDSKQLPPTRFFTKTLSDDEYDEDAESDEELAQAERTESILETCEQAGYPKYLLRWHYRSRHESLIAFSNAHFYGGRLYTFPSPEAQHSDGVRFEYVSGRYDRGGSRTNRLEAERVVELAIRHLREHPDKSLGVVALSEAQQSCIRDIIESRLKQDPALRSAYGNELEESNPHGFFVKSLESVQGDERDVILLSIGYGPDASGKFSQNFGPVNRKGGERRLNVAVTRARHQVIVVASFRADQLGNDIASPGARTLRDYLEYAERGPAVLTEQVRDARTYEGAGDVDFDSPFEEAVCAALAKKGFDIAKQVGCSGYRIDLAVRDPRRPGKYLLGIECDGATYHSSATARDRDRLRQHHLENMGWHIHRIWSRDWVRDSNREVMKVIQALHDAQPTDSTEAPGQEPASSAIVTVPVREASTVAEADRLSYGTDHTYHAHITSAGNGLHPVHGLHAYRSEPKESKTRDGQLDSTGIAATSAVRSCETCAFYQDGTNWRFYCGRDATYKQRSPTGNTEACPAWKRA